MKSIIRAATVVLLAVVAVVVMALPASAQESPTYTGVAPATLDPNASAGNASRADAGAAATGALPVTGGDALPIAQIGVGLLAAGALATFAVRQRKAAAG